MEYYQNLEHVPDHLKTVSTLQFSGSKPNGKITFGFGMARSVAEEIAKLSCRNVFIVTDNIITDLGLDTILTDGLKSAGISYEIFNQVKAEPDLECASTVQRAVQAGGYDAVIGLGGGSVLDMGKIAALSSMNTDEISSYFGGNTFSREGIPLILLPTTSGTGSEISPYIVIKDGSVKKFIGTPLALATIAIIDPLFTVTMPGQVTAATGLDALSHGIEGTVSKLDPFNEALTEKCVELVLRYLPRAFARGDDLEARYYMSFSSILGMMAYSQGGGLYAHSISYILTSSYEIPHGIGCGLSLPYTLALNNDKSSEILKRISRVADSVPSHDSKAAEGIGIVERLIELLQELHVPTSLKGLGIENSLRDEFVEELLSTYERPRNPVKLDNETAGKLFDALYWGDLDKLR